jgi:hypothetical protein
MENGFRFGQWVGMQRTYKEKLSEERRQRLDDLGFLWDVRDADWEEGFSCLIAYKKREGHCRVPNSHVEKTFSLGKWTTRQRTKRDILPDERQKQLDELGFVWDAREAAWEEGFSYLQLYQKKQGHCRVPKTYEENGYRLGQWAGIQRQSKDALSKERHQRLDDLGFTWDHRDAQWQEGFSHLKAYKEREGHCRVPGSHIENGFRLGVWVDTQRQSRRKGRISQERAQRLNGIGFVWNVSDE